MKRRMLLPSAALIAVALIASACLPDSDGDPTRPTAFPTTAPSEGQPRSFELGLSSLPPELTEDSYARAFELAASAGEVILIQRTPPWTEMLSGRVSEETAQTTRRETELAKQYNLDLFVAIDPTDASTGRSQLVDLPPDLLGAGFGDEDVRRAFTAYAAYVAENYRPKYLALGVEINVYQQHRPEDFERFVSLYHETYEAVKARSPETLVFPTFQLEQLHALLPAPEPYLPQWYLLNRFEPRLDVLAVSTFPSLIFAEPSQIPAAYFTQLATYTEHPIAISAMGYTSAEGANGVNDGSEREQADFLARVFDSAQQLSMPLVVWFVGQDPTFTGDLQVEALQHVGLKRQDGSDKIAWSVWLQAARRPLEAATLEQSTGS